MMVERNSQPSGRYLNMDIGSVLGVTVVYRKLGFQGRSFSTIHVIEI
jgi:hypothetical protein